MRAWQVTRAGEPREALRLAECPAPEPPPGFLRVRMEACALDLPDVLMCRGSYALTPVHRFTPGQDSRVWSPSSNGYTRARENA